MKHTFIWKIVAVFAILLNLILYAYDGALSLGFKRVIVVDAALLGLLCFWYIRYITRTALSFSVILLLLSLLFAYSGFLFYLLLGNFAFYYWNIQETGVDLLAQVFILINLFFFSYLLGAIWVSRPASQEMHMPADDHSAERTNYRRYALGLFLVSIAVIVLESLRGTGVSIGMSYQDYNDLALNKRISIFFLVSVNYLLPIASILLVASSENKQAFLWNILKYTVPPILVSALTGDRNVPLTLLIMVLLVNNRYQFFRLTLGRTVVSFAVIFYLMVLIGYNRSALVNQEDPFLHESELNPVYRNRYVSTLLKQGTSSQTFLGTIIRVPALEDYRYGKDYARSIVTSIPFMQGIFDFDFARKFAGGDSRPTEWITYHFSKNPESGLGYLYIAECYLQFGLIGILVLPFLFSYIIDYVWRRANTAVSIQTFGFCLSVFIGMMNWVRNDFYVVAKYITWSYLLIIVIPWILIKLKILRA